MAYPTLFLLLFTVFILHGVLPSSSSSSAAAAAAKLDGYGYCEVQTLKKLIKLTQEPTSTSTCPRTQTLRTEKTAIRLNLRTMVSFSGSRLNVKYVVTVGLGGRYMTLLIDTGSDLTWVQCEPCISCYDQEEPIFNPWQSPSYKPILCQSTSCYTSVYATHYCVINSVCDYYVNYADRSYTGGDLATDNLVLGTRLVKDFVFGCGRVNYGSFGRVSGIMGLGKSGVSIASQTYDVFGGVFSYCLPPMTEKGSGSLILGDDISLYKNITPISYTNMIPNKMMPNYYFIKLTGISIDGVALQDPSFGHEEMLIDSGTSITRLKPTVYEAVKTEFIKHFADFPKAPSVSIFDTCFNLSAYYKEPDIHIPVMEMHFGTATLTVDEILYFVSIDMSQVCLGIAGWSGEDELNVIGSYQQANTRVVYNVKESRIGFAKEICNLD